ncbi:MAG: cell division topological specificity factor MinE [Caldisericia bacterium]|nr:cell division topological specificity factor MinE [Caldisericia bacterium]
MASGKTATQRLKNVISKDRELLSSGSIRVLKKELGNIVSKFLDIDKRKIQITIEEADQKNYNLSANFQKKSKAEDEME